MMGASSSVAFDSKGHLYVLSRGAKPLTEFDENGKFIRAFGEGLFTRSHGIRIDKDGNIWATDVGAHTVMKLSPMGRFFSRSAPRARRASGMKPPDAALQRTERHRHRRQWRPLHHAGPHARSRTRRQPQNPGVLKFDKNGKFIKFWGGKGTEPGKFEVAHGIAIDAKGLLWVTDRENQRIQIFDQDGKYIREVKYAGLPCALDIGKQNIYMVNGFAGQLLKMDLDGKVLAAVGKPGPAGTWGEFGEAHFIAVSPQGRDLRRRFGQSRRAEVRPGSSQD